MKSIMSSAGCRGGERARGNHPQGGFTLIEIMITVVIVAILLGIAIPSYHEYIKRARRTDAKITLMTIAQNMERHFTANASYQNAVLGPPPPPPSTSVSVYDSNRSPDGFYNLSLNVITPNTYTLTATPVAGTTQSQDSDCAVFTIDEQGVRGSSPKDVNVCWAK